MPNAALIPDRPEYYVQTGSMFENPYGVPHDEIVAMLLELPSEMAAQVIFGKYVESSGLVFTGEMIQMLFDRLAEHYAGIWGREFRVTGDRWVDEDTQKLAAMMRPREAYEWDPRARSFATGVDLARKNDYTVITTLDVRYRPARVVYYRRLNRVPWETIYTAIGRCAYAFGPSILADSTGMAGDVIMENLADRYYCPLHDRTITREAGLCRDRHGNPLGGCGLHVYMPLSCVEGFEFTTKSKVNLMEHLRNCMSHGYRQGSDEPFGLLRCPPVVQIEEELSFYAWDDKGLDTDTVMSLALAAWQGLEDVPAEAAVGSVHGR